MKAEITIRRKFEHTVVVEIGKDISLEDYKALYHAGDEVQDTHPAADIGEGLIGNWRNCSPSDYYVEIDINELVAEEVAQ